MRRRKGEPVKEEFGEWVKDEGAKKEKSGEERQEYEPEKLSLFLKSVGFLSNLTLSTFFSRVEVVNAENIPRTGPCILFGNHNNQFVDGMVFYRAAARPISMVIAESSMHKPIIGPLARATHAVPVVRPQDRRFVGQGKIVSIDRGEQVVQGSDGAQFMEELHKGCTVEVEGMGNMVVESVVDSTTFRYSKSALAPLGDGVDGCSGRYTVTPKVKHEEMFEKVYEFLQNGRCIGIFPEGGSHDNTKLLPLKAGVALMCLGALAEGVPCKLIPVGINYFAAHHFRSTVFVDVGKPVVIEEELVEMYKAKDSRREACNILLARMKKALEITVITADDFATLKTLRTARRMYQNKATLSSKEYIELNLQFSYSFNQLKDVDAVKQLQWDVSEYLEFARSQGLKDKEVRDLPPLGSLRTLANAIGDILITYFMAIAVVPVCLPGWLFYVPIIVYTRRRIPKLMEKALAKSKVKVAARDVVASHTIMIALKLVPILHVVYSAFWFSVLMYLWPTINRFAYGRMFTSHAWWTVPFVFTLGPFYQFYFCPLMFEKLARRWRLLPKYRLCLKAYFHSGQHPAELLRMERKKLVVRIQDLVHAYVKKNPDKWLANHPIILKRGTLLRQRSSSTQEVAKGDLQSKIPPSASYENLSSLGSASR